MSFVFSGGITASDPAAIIAAISHYRAVPEGEMVGGLCRTSPVVWARHEVAFFLRGMTRMSYAQIGHRMGGRDPTTVMHSINRVATRVNDDAVYAASFYGLKRFIESQHPRPEDHPGDGAARMARQLMTAEAPDPAAAQALALVFLAVVAILRTPDLTDAEARTASLTYVENAARPDHA